MISLGRRSYNAAHDIQCYEGVELQIGNFSSIGSKLVIYSGLHACVEHPQVVSQFPFFEKWGLDYPPCKMGGKVVIGSDVWISTNVGILDGVTIGDGAIVGAGAMVTKDVEPYSFVAGNPARHKRYRFDAEIVAKMLKIKWWDWSDSDIRQAIKSGSMSDISLFVEKYYVDNTAKEGHD